MNKNRRKHFLINKPFQFRYMLFVTAPLLIICTIALLSFYIGIWGSVLDVFSDAQLRKDLLTASRMVQYEEARLGSPEAEFSSLTFFKQTEKLSQRQREVFKDILNETNGKLLIKFFILMFFIAWGTIYVSHKIAGPLFHFGKVLNAMDKGDYSARAHLRKFDEAHPLAKKFNVVLTKTDDIFSNLKKISAQDDSGKALTEIKEELSKIKTSADR